MTIDSLPRSFPSAPRPRTRFPARRRLVAAIAVAVLAALPAVAGFAQAPPAAGGRSTGRYVVRPGDTLIGLSGRVSGDPALWRQNWKLNPEVAEPDLLTPGSSLILLLAREVPPDHARLTAVSRAVEERPRPHPWADARVDDLLREADALRTRERSSAEVAFTDGSRLRLTESSLVFLLRVGEALQGVERDEIEIVEGQADLGVADPRRRPAGIDIVVGSARAVPRPGPDGGLATRARRADAGTAQVMVYAGDSAVTAGGEEVEVGAGMGTVVAAGAPPSPPEALLPAPRLSAPPAGAALPRPDPELRWQPVTGAAAYTVEICFDSACARLAERRVGLPAPAFKPRLARGAYHWRATAVAPSGLDGFPSATAALTVTDDRADDRAPRLSPLRVAGPAVRLGDTLVLGAEATLAVTAEDDRSPVAAWTYRLDGATVGREAWAGGWRPGPHRVSVSVADGAGNRADSDEVSFVADPVPPRIELAAADASEVAASGAVGLDPTRAGAELRARLAGWTPLEWSSDGARWLPLVPRGRRRALASVFADRPQLIVRARGRGLPVWLDGAIAPAVLAGGDAGGAGLGDRYLVVRARDEQSAVGRLALGLTEQVLWIEATDLVGNTARVELPLAVRP